MNIDLNRFRVKQKCPKCGKMTYGLTGGVCIDCYRKEHPRNPNEPKTELDEALSEDMSPYIKEEDHYWYKKD